MKKRINLVHPLTIFIVVQLAWLSLVILWIYWYVSNYQILNKIGENLLPQIVSKNINIAALVWGLILLVLVLVGMYFIFIYLAKQINITRLYDSFIANISHELKSPLASIQLYLETLKLRKVSDTKKKEFYDLMIKDTNRLRNLINSILDIAQIEQKKMAYNFQVYLAKKIIDTMIQESLDKFNLSKEAILIEGESLCEIKIDVDALKIVIDNLIDNALKYSIEPLKLIIKNECYNNKFYLRFTDNGVGISLPDQKKIFNKFFRLTTSNIPNIKGTGLGLYLVREIIKSHGGRISVYSEGLNLGTTFKIELPVYQNSKKTFLKNFIQNKPKRKIA